MRSTPAAGGGALIARRLGERKREIEQTTLVRVYGIAEPPATAELDYLHGLREAVSAAIDFGLEVLSRSDDHPPRVPAALLVQARLAARNGVALDVVLRRYFAGYTLFTNFVFEEVHRVARAGGEGSSPVLHHKSSQFDRLVGAIAEEYRREIEAGTGTRSISELQTRLAERLLAGELVDAGLLAYDVHRNCHVAMIFADRDGIAGMLRAVAKTLDCRLLHVRRRTGPGWAWLGRRSSLNAAEVQAEIEKEAGGIPMAVGQPCRGLEGWRLSYRQARAVYPFVQRDGCKVVSYAEAGLIAAMAKDDVLVASLRQLYIEPLTGERDGGEGLKETVRAYLAAGRNITSAASALRVNRQTVRTRLRAVEAKIGRSLDDCGAEMEFALRLDRELGADADLAFLAETG